MLMHRLTNVSIDISWNSKDGAKAMRGAVLESGRRISPDSTAHNFNWWSQRLNYKGDWRIPLINARRPDAQGRLIVVPVAIADQHFQRKQRGVENSGEGKTYRKTPSQKPFWTPPPMIRFPPPFVFALLFSLEETGTDQANPTF